VAGFKASAPSTAIAFECLNGELMVSLKRSRPNDKPMRLFTQPEQTEPSHHPPTRRAVVIGASIAGLLAARVLSDFFDSVIVVDSDRLPSQIAVRRGVPQSVQPHVLFARGYRILQELFPDIDQDLLAAGALPIDWAREFHHFGEGGWSRNSTVPSDIVSVTCSRPLLEGVVRQRVANLPTVQFLPQHRGIGLLSKPGSQQVRGITLQPLGDAPVKELAAALVVEASGRRSVAPQWLDKLGWTPPPETLINPFLGYATCRYRIPSGDAAWKILLISQQPPHQKRLGYLAAIEAGEWIATLGGYGRDFPPTDEAGFLEFAHSLPNPRFYQLIKDAEPVSPIYAYRATANHLRQYEQVQMPQGFVALGDAVCALCPVYGQGMTVAALSALVLQDELKRAMQKATLIPDSAQFQKQLARSNAIHWMLATGQDSRFVTTAGRVQPGWVGKAMGWYMQQLMRTTSVDEQLHLQFVAVAQALQSPLALYHPKVMLRMIRPLLGAVVH
jgi:2-polyprenyl-6-methoxyphenol hydroxylase-like FAD-dependent oxidoreductase